MTTSDAESQPAPPLEDVAPQPFASEPETLDQLLELYVVENKVPARDPGCTLMLTSATRRDGSKVEMVDGQKLKLWLASWLYHILKCVYS